MYYPHMTLYMYSWTHVLSTHDVIYLQVDTGIIHTWRYISIGGHMYYPHMALYIYRWTHLFKPSSSGPSLLTMHLYLPTALRTPRLYGALYNEGFAQRRHSFDGDSFQSCIYIYIYGLRVSCGAMASNKGISGELLIQSCEYLLRMLSFTVYSTHSHINLRARQMSPVVFHDPGWTRDLPRVCYAKVCDP